MTYPGGQLDKLKCYIQAQKQIEADDASLVDSVIEIEERRNAEASQNKVNKNLNCMFLLGKEALMV